MARVYAEISGAQEGKSRAAYAQAMRSAASLIGILTALAGLVWIAQGLNLPFAPRSFMTADRTWIVFGAAAVLLGGILWSWGRRQRGPG